MSHFRGMVQSYEDPPPANNSMKALENAKPRSGSESHNDRSFILSGENILQLKSDIHHSAEYE